MTTSSSNNGQSWSYDPKTGKHKTVRAETKKNHSQGHHKPRGS